MSHAVVPTDTPTLTLVPPLEDGAWVRITPDLLYAWQQSADQDRKREADKPRGRIPAARPNNRSVRP